MVAAVVCLPDSEAFAALSIKVGTLAQLGLLCHIHHLTIFLLNVFKHCRWLVAGRMTDGLSSRWTSVAMIVHIKGDLQITNIHGRRLSLGVGAAA